MKRIWSNWMRLLGALPLACIAVVLVIAAGGQEAGKMIHAPDRSYCLRLPTNWEAETVKDGLGREQLAIFFESPEKAKLEIRKLPATALFTAQAMAERDEAQSVRFKTGYVKGEIVSLTNLKPDAEVALLAYTFIQDGKPMFGRNYYLRCENHQAYLLRFTLAPDALPSQQTHLPLIVQSFRLLTPASIFS